MLARLQQLTTGAVMAAAVAWLVFAAHRGWSGAAVLGALLIVFCYAPVLALEFVLLGWTHGSDPTPRASASARVRAWWGEMWTAPRVFYWRQPFRSQAQPDCLPAAGRDRRGVLLVHGFVCNRGFWNPWMARLRAAGVPFVAVNLEPVFGEIDRYAPIVERAVQRLEASTGRPPVIVAHSMGGLAVRAWLAAQRSDARVHRVITIGTPHRGTWLGRFGRTPNTRQMRIGSAWLHRLSAGEPAERHARFTCFYSHCDNIVFPPANATLPGADNRHLPGWSHVHLAFHPAVFDEVLRWLSPP
jgi:triacylglycerol esterase/lipase EstA (alpha/beta hydrolase family)